MGSKGGAPKGNSNAEKWTVEFVRDFFDLCLEIGETQPKIYTWIALVDALKQSEFEKIHGVTINHYTWDYLIDKFDESVDFAYIKNKIYKRIENNIIMDALDGKIHATVAIALLNNHHEWSQRNDHKHTGQQEIKVIKEIINADNQTQADSSTD